MCRETSGVSQNTDTYTCLSCELQTLTQKPAPVLNPSCCSVHPAGLGQQKEEKARASGSADQGFQAEVALPDLQWIQGLTLETVSRASLNKPVALNFPGR